MAMKDYYAILMVHPQAELFLIEAAYKRLAREYHPDRGPGQHDKMVEINEAFAVLSNPTRRRSYDQEYAQQSLSNQLFATTATKQRDTKRAPQTAPAKVADPLRGNVSPVPPDPAAFGIAAGYLERARAGAQTWTQREHRIPHRVKWMTRAIGAFAGLTFSLVFFRSGGQPLAAFAWLVVLLLAELSMRLIERIRDAHLLRYKYNPLYNPNPAGYRAYAAERAKYEAETMIVYVTRDALFHAQKTCQAMTSYDPMPKWFARLRNARPCPRCARALTVVPKHLPPPFGKGAD
jgi:curved DNA-binding protein CbpA